MESPCLNRHGTTNALEIMWNEFFEGRPKMIAALEEQRLQDAVGRQVHEMREAAGMTQAELARRAGTTQSAIARLEDADYKGHSLSMLRRIASALGHRVEVRFAKEPAATVDERRSPVRSPHPRGRVSASGAIVAKETPARYGRSRAAKKK